MSALSPYFLKRFLSAILIGPVALLLLLASPVTFWIVVVPVFCLAAYEWIGIVRAVPRAQKILTAVVGLIYLPLCFYAFAALRIEPVAGGWLTTLWLLLSVWASDTGGYIVGKAYGGPKWVPRISPNKTWAGLGGAMAGAGLVTLIMALTLDPSLVGPAEFLRDFLLGAVLGFVCQIGDLFVSVFKRRAGLKDTGNVIPGHGGILDRIDSLLLASVFVFIGAKIFMP